jgi:PUA-domain protein
MELRIRNRARLRRKEIEDLASRLQTEFGTSSMFTETDPVEFGDYEGGRVILLGHDIIGLLHEEKPALAVRGLLKYTPSKRFVTVDMGAVRFVTNGADVMGPGIVDADPEIKAGDLVWVREERHKKPLAVGQALSDGPLLKTKPKGKQIKSLHFVGDRIWVWGQEEPKAAPSASAPPTDEDPSE